MSAVLCGKRSFFEEVPAQASGSAATPIAKKLRCSSSTSPVRFSVSQSPPGSIQQFKSQFPDIGNQDLEECGHNFDASNTRSSEVRHEALQRKPCTIVEEVSYTQSIPQPSDGVAVSTEDHTHTPSDGVQWVDMFVREMMSAANVDDARSRATKLLESLERAICARFNGEEAQNVQKENMMLKEQVEGLIRENGILKRAVAIQHERQKQFEDKTQEVLQLKHLLSQYHEQLRILEVNNYALTIHLQQAQQSNSIPGQFHPDVF